MQFLIIILGLLLSGCASTGKVEPIKDIRGISDELAMESLVEKPDFTSNIRFTYLIAWNKIPVGRIIAEIRAPLTYKGREVYVVSLTTESNDFLSKIYRVEDTYTTYVDTESFTSRRYEADRKEGNYRKHVIVEYDFSTNEATYTNLTDGSVKKCAITDAVQDPLSAVCFFMTRDLRPGEKIEIVVNLNEKNYNVYGIIEDLQAVRTPTLGTFAAFKIEPYAELKNNRYKKGRGWLYFSADKNRYPLYGVVQTPFGRVTATLKTIENI